MKGQPNGVLLEQAKLVILDEIKSDRLLKT